MSNGWAKWPKLRCVVEAKVPPGSYIRAADLIYQVQQALESEYGSTVPLPRSAPIRHLRSKFRVLHFGKVIAADKRRQETT